MYQNETNVARRNNQMFKRAVRSFGRVFFFIHRVRKRAMKTEDQSPRTRAASSTNWLAEIIEVAISTMDLRLSWLCF